MRHCVLLCLLFATVTVADVPEDWEEFKQGPGGKIEDKSGSWYAISVAKGGMVGIRRDIPDNPPFSAIYVMVPEVEQSGYTVGVFINTADGAIVKVERFVGNGKQKARFTALAGKRQFGQREVDLPSGTVELQLIRAEDRFTARAKGRKKY